MKRSTSSSGLTCTKANFRFEQRVIHSDRCLLFSAMFCSVLFSLALSRCFSVTSLFSVCASITIDTAGFHTFLLLLLLRSFFGTMHFCMIVDRTDRMHAARPDISSGWKYENLCSFLFYCCYLWLPYNSSHPERCSFSLSLFRSGLAFITTYYVSVCTKISFELLSFNLRVPF